jgi:hypothetical protein
MCNIPPAEHCRTPAEFCLVIGANSLTVGSFILVITVVHRPLKIDAQLRCVSPLPFPGARGLRDFSNRESFLLEFMDERPVVLECYGD